MSCSLGHFGVCRWHNIPAACGCTMGIKSIFACAAVQPSLCLCRELCCALRCLLSTLPSLLPLPSLDCDSALVRRLAAALVAVANVSAKRVNVILVFSASASGCRRCGCFMLVSDPRSGTETLKKSLQTNNKKSVRVKNFANENMNITANCNSNRIKFEIDISRERNE